MVGSWEVNVSIDGMPEKVATAVSELDSMAGAEYTPIAYLGSQVVNGTNHAVLAEQTIVCGKDVKNVVLLIFHETKEGVTLANIERIVEGGAEFGGVQINVEKGDEINKTAQQLLDEAFGGFCGTVVEPIALLGTQIVRGTNYIFVCEVHPAIFAEDDKRSKVKLITLNDMGSEPTSVDILSPGIENNAIAAARGMLKLQSPWVLFYKEVCALFARDPEVKVLFNNEEPELKIQVKGNDEKAACIARFFPKEKAFGNIVLTCSVVGDNGQPVPDVDLPDSIAIQKVFEGNGALSFIKEIQTPFQYTITYVVFVKEVVQYYSDNMYDLYGATSTVYENLARDIFEQPFRNENYCSFCTDAEISLGCPLGEWP